MSQRTTWLGLAGFLVLCAAVSAIGGVVTATSVDTWYATIAKPSFNPPNWIFGPVWTALYIAIAFAGWRVWRLGGFAANRLALILWGLQLAVNLAWSFLFFGAKEIGIAFAEILVLFSLVLVTGCFLWRADRVAGLLFLPYAAWVAFASLLNGAIWRLN